MAKIKICGLTNFDDALFCAEAGADYLGFVMVASSPRSISAERLAGFAGRLPPRAGKVGVFADAPVGEVIGTAVRCGLDAVQLHGIETEAYCLAVEKALGGRVEVWKALPMVSREALGLALGEFGGRTLLADGERGGSKRACSHGLVRELVSSGRSRVFLAGGLTPANVSAAIAEAGPWGVDVASGVESAPGAKDRAMVASFIENARRKI